MIKHSLLFSPIIDSKHCNVVSCFPLHPYVRTQTHTTHAYASQSSDNTLIIHHISVIYYFVFSSFSFQPNVAVIIPIHTHTHTRESAYILNKHHQHHHHRCSMLIHLVIVLVYCINGCLPMFDCSNQCSSNTRELNSIYLCLATNRKKAEADQFQTVVELYFGFSSHFISLSFSSSKLMCLFSRCLC